MHASFIIQLALLSDPLRSKGGMQPTFLTYVNPTTTVVVSWFTGIYIHINPPPGFLYIHTSLSRRGISGLRIIQTERERKVYRLENKT